MLAQLKATTYFPPSLLPSNGQGDPLSIVSALVVDSEKQDIKVEKILGAPTDLGGGTYTFQVEPRAKSGKPGMNLWYRAHKYAAE